MSAPWELEWAEDPAFVWVAAGQLLLALGVREETVRPLGELRPLYEKWDSALHGGPGGTLATPPLDSLPRRQRAELDDDLGRALAILLPVAEEALEQLDRRQIRPEIMGIRRDALDGALTDLRRYAASEGWRGEDEQAIQGHVQWITDGHRWKTPLQPPGPGEVGRIVDVLSAMPRPTLRRIAGVSNRPALMALVGGWFTMVHSGRTEDGTAVAPELTSEQSDPVAELQREMDRRDAELEEQLARNRAERERDNRQFEHRVALMRWMSLVGSLPTLGFLVVLAVGAVLPLAGDDYSMIRQVLPMAGAVSSAIGAVAMPVLLLMAFTGSSHTTEDQRLLRSNTSGGMLMVAGLWNMAVGLFPAVMALTEPEYVTAGILGGAFAVLALAAALIGAVHRERARKQAGLPKDDIPFYVP